MINPFEAVRNFEKALAEYTGAPYVATVDSCTNALFLACKYLKVEEVTIPAKTYTSVPCAIIHAGGRVNFKHYSWSGAYYLEPYPIVDAAKRLTRNMYVPGTFTCLSFHSKKLLPIGRGGAILTDSEEAYKWFKVARFDGRHEVPLNEDVFEMVGWNCYMTPEQAARGHLLLSHMGGKPNADQPMEDYPDLSVYDMYKTANR